MNKEDFADIAVYLHNLPITEKCDGTLYYTKRFVRRHLPHLNPNEVQKFMEEHGAHCDCEVLLNVLCEVFPSKEECNEYCAAAEKKWQEKQEAYKESQRRTSKRLLEQKAEEVRLWLATHPDVLGSLKETVSRKTKKEANKWIRHEIIKKMYPSKSSACFPIEAVLLALEEKEKIV